MTALIVPKRCQKCGAEPVRVIVHVCPENSLAVCDGFCVANLGAAGPDFVEWRTANPPPAITERWSYCWFNWREGVYRNWRSS